MKRKLSLLLILCVIMQIMGCSLPSPSPPITSAPSTQPPTITTEETSIPVITETTPPDTPQIPLVSISLPVITESATAENGTVIFNYVFQNISLITQDADVASLIIVDFLNRVDSTRAIAENIYMQAEAAYTGQQEWIPYLCMLSYRPTRIDTGILSMLGTQVSHYGSPHPETVYHSLNYDMVTGGVLSLGDILPDTTSIDALLDLVLQILDAQQETLYLYENYEQTVRSSFSGNSLQNSWYFSPSGLCIFFAPYEIAPYSSGVITAVIPYDALTGIIDDRYFPAESETAYGTMFTGDFLQTDLNTINKFSELVLDTEGDKVLLYTDHMVRNIRIETGIWSSSGSFYTPEHTVYCASALVAGDALMLEASFTDTLPQLLLTYETDNATVSRFILKDETGKIVLSKE